MKISLGHSSVHWVRCIFRSLICSLG